MCTGRSGAATCPHPCQGCGTPSGPSCSVSRQRCLLLLHLKAFPCHWCSPPSPSCPCSPHPSCPCPPWRSGGALGAFPGFLSPTSGHTTNHKTEMLWAIQPTDMLWAIQPTGMLWAIQPTEALGYPAHRNALGYPAQSFSPQKLWAIQPTEMLWAIQPTEMLGAIQPTEMFWAIQLTEMLWDIQPTEMLWAIQPTEIYIQPTLPCASTHLIFSLHMSSYLFSFFSL